MQNAMNAFFNGDAGGSKQPTDEAQKKVGEIWEKFKGE